MFQNRPSAKVNVDQKFDEHDQMVTNDEEAFEVNVLRKTRSYVYIIQPLAMTGIK